jgi:hypothetical protein
MAAQPIGQPRREKREAAAVDPIGLGVHPLGGRVDALGPRPVICSRLATRSTPATLRRLASLWRRRRPAGGKLRAPIRMERPLAINPSIRVSAEVVALRLQEIGGQTRSTVAVIVR